MIKHIHTITAEDVGKTLVPQSCPTCGKGNPICIGIVTGPVQRIDIGKRVFYNDGVIQVENDLQRDKRLKNL